MHKYPQVVKILPFILFFNVMLHTCLSVNPDKPCTTAKNEDAHDNFLYRHLPEGIPKNDDKDMEMMKDNWKKFITDMKTLNREVQSFLPYEKKKEVLDICSSEGKKYRENLCISKKVFSFITVKIKNQKDVESVVNETKHVIVACDKIKKENKCLPVHFEANINNAKPDESKADCNAK